MEDDPGRGLSVGGGGGGPGRRTGGSALQDGGRAGAGAGRGGRLGGAPRNTLDSRTVHHLLFREAVPLGLPFWE